MKPGDRLGPDLREHFGADTLALTDQTKCFDDWKCGDYLLNSVCVPPSREQRLSENEPQHYFLGPTMSQLVNTHRKSI